MEEREQYIEDDKGQNKGIIIFLVLIILGLGGFLVYTQFFVNDDTPEVNEPDEPEPEEDEVDEITCATKPLQGHGMISGTIGDVPWKISNECDGVEETEAPCFGRFFVTFGEGEKIFLDKWGRSDHAPVVILPVQNAQLLVLGFYSDETGEGHLVAFNLGGEIVFEESIGQHYLVGSSEGNGDTFLVLMEESFGGDTYLVRFDIMGNQINIDKCS